MLKLPSRLGVIAVFAATTLSIWACSEQALPTSPPRSLTPQSTRSTSNVIPAVEAKAFLCPEGPAGTYTYTISLNVPQTFTVNGQTFDYGAANIALVQTPAYQTITLGTVSYPAGTCQQIGTILQSLDFPADGIIADPERFLTITQTSGPVGTTLSNIVTTEQGQGDVTTTPPPSSATINFNFFHGAVATFNNTTTPPSCPPSSITSNFNGTAIAAGNFIWFNAVFKPSGVPSAGGVVNFDNGAVTFTSGGTNYSVPVPGSTVTFSSSATQASTTFDGVRWQTTVPANYTGNIFLGGVPFQVPAGGLPGGTPTVVWSEQMTSNIPSMKLNWQWAAAVYKSFSTDNTQLGVKPVDSNSLSIYLNSDHAGTPENFKSFVTGGARGGGGSNFTGSYSGTGTGTICQQ